MNEKEVAEIRRRFKPDKSNITNVRGCYVNEKGEIAAEFNPSVPLMPDDEAEKILAILKKTLSGGIDKNLIGIEFSTEQVVKSEEHGLLMTLRDSKLKDEEAVQTFFKKVIEAVTMEESYLILLAQDSYDVPYRSGDGEIQGEASTDVFSYMLCSICPVKMTKPALSYYVHENEFHSRAADWLVSPPELGFMFPSFDDRAANIYGALYYTKDTVQSHSEFTDAIFNREIPPPAAAQKESFGSLLGSTLGEDGSYDVVQAVHGRLAEMVEEHKVNKEPEPLTVSKGTVKQILQRSGVSAPRVEAFEEQYDAEFGPETTLSPKNIVDIKQTEVALPDVTIKVSPHRSDLVETRVIDGSKYILIRVEEGVELNGVPIHIS